MDVEWTADLTREDEAHEAQERAVADTLRRYGEAAARHDAHTRRGGGGLIGRLGPVSRTHAATLRFLENAYLASGETNYNPLVMLACSIADNHFQDSVVPQSRPWIVRLVEGCGAEDDVARQYLQAWRDGRHKTTLGVVGFLFVAWRRASASTWAVDALNANWMSPYLNALQGKHFERALGVLRDRYRNPCIHDPVIMDEKGYAALAALLFGVSSIDTWDGGGARPPISAGIVHHHVTLRRA